MREHLEIILPPVPDVRGAVEKLMAPFCEPAGESIDVRSGMEFCDFWQVGGRYSAYHELRTLDSGKLRRFTNHLREHGITVSPMRMGKLLLCPSSQIQVVAELWREWFPESKLATCPIFEGDQKDSVRYAFPDVVRVADLPYGYWADRVLIAGKDLRGEIEPSFMTARDFYTGLNWVTSDWDTRISSAIEERLEELENAEAEYGAANRPTGDWLAVTVDYRR